MMKKNFKSVMSIIICAALLCTSVGVSAFALNKSEEKTSTSQSETKKEEKNTDKKSESEESDKNVKDETVYVIANADGSAKKVIVSDWIKNGLKQQKLNDVSTLTDIENVKGNEGYTLNGENMRVWDADGNDIYYQGNTDKELPVSMTVTYKLDGKTISADELAGKSGKLIMRFDYKNNQYENVKIDGKEEKIYVPFVMLTGMLLDNSHFTSVDVTNGKIINDGDRTAVMGIALPGLQSNLNIDSKELEIPDYVEISADVKNFELETTVTVATNDVFNQIDEKKLNEKEEDVKKALNTLTSAMKQLTDGSSQLYDGLSTLLDKSGDLISGIDSLLQGSKTLKNGAGDLASGASELQNGVEKLSSGLSQISANNAKLNGGAKQVFESLLSVADSQLESAGVKADKLTIDNYSKVLNGILSTLDKDAVYKLAYDTALQKVTSAVNAQYDTIHTAVITATKAKVKEGVLANLGYTVENYDAAVAAGIVDAETQGAVEAAIDAQFNKAETQAAIESATQSQISKIIDENMKSDEVQSGIAAAVAKAEVGSSSINSLKKQLDSYNDFYTGLLTYTDKVSEASNGASTLKKGTDALKNGTDELYSGTKKLYSGIETMQNGGSSLVSGVKSLKDGSMKLSDGLKEFDKNGVQKLSDAVNGDIASLVKRLRSTIEVSKKYVSFSGISDDMDGEVKFLYRTETIKPESSKSDNSKSTDKNSDK